MYGYLTIIDLIPKAYFLELVYLPEIVLLSVLKVSQAVLGYDIDDGIPKSYKVLIAKLIGVLTLVSDYLVIWNSDSYFIIV